MRWGTIASAVSSRQGRCGHRHESVDLTASSIFAAEFPSPYGRTPLWPTSKSRNAESRASDVGDTSRFQPVSTSSTHSVSVLRVTQGTPWKKASFWTPPESVAMNLACFSSIAMSRYPTGPMTRMLDGMVMPNSPMRRFVRGCSGSTTGQPHPPNARRSRSSRNLSSVFS